MTTYAGPVPPAPVPGTPPESPLWTNWWQYQTVLTNSRYENEREAARVLAAARVLVTDEQHRQKMAAEAACAEANTKLAEAQQAMAAAVRAAYAPNDTPDPAIPVPPSDQPVDTLLADAFAVLRRLQAAYAPRTSP